MKHLKTTLAVLALAAAMTLSLTACRKGAADIESPFKNMETVDMSGSAVTSAELSEHTLNVINVWNLGCTPCINEIPELDKLNTEYADKGVAVMGLYYNTRSDLSDTERQEITAVMKDAGASYPHLLVSEDMMKTEELKDVSTFPATYLVDAQGNIVEKILGSRDYEGWAKIVDQALEKVEKNA